jgi:hypothetical protein
MTGQRDIDRTLDAWFVDGPSVMPDRLFDAVLDQVERTPQRPFARLRLRLTDMNPKIRLLTATAAGLATVLVALTLINRPTDDNVGATSSPSTAPSTSAGSALPQELRATWLSAPRTIPETDPGVGVTHVLAANSSTFTTSRAASGDFQYVSRVESVDSDTIRFSTLSANAICAASAGTYTWSLTASGETLELVSDEDDTCPLRGATIGGTYWRSDCPAPDDECLGKLDAGTYGSQFLDPFLTIDDDWVRRYGALTYTVPDGWENRSDYPGEFRLAPQGAPDTTHVTIVSDVVVASRADNCTEEQDPDAGTNAEGMVAALSRPGVTVSTPVPVSFGGLSGLRVDLALDESWTTPCPWSEGRPYALLFVDRPAQEGFAWGLDAELRMRTYFLDVGEDRAIMIDIETASEAEQAAFVDGASAIVESFVFTP